MTVHFNVHMDPSKEKTEAEELSEVIKREIATASNDTDNSVLGELVIDAESLEIQGKC